MALNDEQIRGLFRQMHDNTSSTKKLATASRANQAPHFDGDGFLARFDEMLEAQLDVAEDVYRSFGLDA